MAPARWGSLREAAACVFLASGMSLCGAAMAQEIEMGVRTTTSAGAFDRTQSPGTESIVGSGAVSSRASMDGQLGGLSGGSWASAWGRVDYGRMQLQAGGGAYLRGSGPVGEVLSSAEAHAQLTDTFLITCPACVEGTVATVTFRLMADDGVFVDGNTVQDPDGFGSRFSAYSSVSSSFHMGAPDANSPGDPVMDGLFHSELFERFGGSSHDRPMWNGWHTASFIIGQPLSFTWEATVQGLASVGSFNPETTMDGTAVFNSSFAHSFYWGGITEVRDSNGQLLSGITALNAVGVDYANALAPPVPEPAAGLLAVVGVMLLVWIKRRRRISRAIGPRQVAPR